MDQLREFLELVREQQAVRGRLRGLLHLLIGRRLTQGETLVSAGMTWRDLSALLKKLRWERDEVRQLGLDPAELPPRDREKFWYAAIGRAGVLTAEASAEADALAEPLRALGYEIGPAPGGKEPAGGPEKGRRKKKE